MINLYDSASNTSVGQISEADLKFLIDNMEEEFPEDQDYSITPLELAYWEENSAPTGLMSVLRQILGERDEVILRWSRS